MKPTMRVAGAAMVFAVAFSGLGASPASAEPDFGLDDDYSWSPVETSTDYFSDAFEDLSIGDGLAFDADYSFGDDLRFDLGDDLRFDLDDDFGVEFDGATDYDFSAALDHSVDGFLDNAIASMGDDDGARFDTTYSPGKITNAAPGEVLGETTFFGKKMTITKATKNDVETSKRHVTGGMPGHCAMVVHTHDFSPFTKEALEKIAGRFRNVYIKGPNSEGIEIVVNMCGTPMAASLAASSDPGHRTASDVSDPFFETSQVSAAGTFGLIMLGLGYTVAVQTAMALTYGLLKEIFGFAHPTGWWQHGYRVLIECLSGFIGAWGTMNWPMGGWGVTGITNKVVKSASGCLFNALKENFNRLQIKSPEVQHKMVVALKDFLIKLVGKASAYWTDVEANLNWGWQTVGAWASDHGRTFTRNANLYWHRVWGSITAFAGVIAGQTVAQLVNRAQGVADIANTSDAASSYSEEFSFGSTSLDLDSVDLDSFDVSGLDFVDDDYSLLGDFGGTDEVSYLDFGVADSFEPLRQWS